MHWPFWVVKWVNLTFFRRSVHDNRVASMCSGLRRQCVRHSRTVVVRRRKTCKHTQWICMFIYHCISAHVFAWIWTRASDLHAFLSAQLSTVARPHAMKEISENISWFFSDTKTSTLSYTHIHACTRKHTHAHAHAHTRTHAHTHALTHTYTHTHTHKHPHTHKHTHTHTDALSHTTCIQSLTHIVVYVAVYIWQGRRQDSSQNSSQCACLLFSFLSSPLLFSSVDLCAKPYVPSSPLVLVAIRSCQSIPDPA